MSLRVLACLPACLITLHSSSIAITERLPTDRTTQTKTTTNGAELCLPACLPHCVPQSSSSTYTILSPSSSTADRLTHSQSFSLRAPHNIRHHRKQPHKPHHDEVVSTCDRPTDRPPAAGPPPIPLLLRNAACAVRARYRNAGWLAGWWRSRYHAQLLLYTVVGRTQVPLFRHPSSSSSSCTILN